LRASWLRRATQTANSTDERSQPRALLLTHWLRTKECVRSFNNVEVQMRAGGQARR
jgi:hypothetical protein